MNVWVANPLGLSLPAKTPGFLADVLSGLCRSEQKSLPPKYLYDELGSLLFEAITRLPEYGVWRAENRLLDAHSESIAASSLAGLVVELGSGSAEKTRSILLELLEQRRVTYCAVEISRSALDASRRALADLQGLEIRGIAREYLAGLADALRQRRNDEPALVLFLGSSLGNFDSVDAAEFLQSVRDLLLPGDCLLLGTDLDKSELRLLCAYDDVLGVTAAFNLNLLVRMNRELQADFRLPYFRHRVRFNRALRNVEMHIESLRDQTVTLGNGAFCVTLRAGETIHTESSHKYSLDELETLLQAASFRRAEQWCDHEWGFATGLYVAE